MSTPLLIVVHPGSLVGSLNMHWGWRSGNCIRDAITQEIKNWEGDVAVVEGDLDDELTGWKAAGLNAALARASFRVYGSPDEDGLSEAALQIAGHFKLEKGNRVFVTGAWNDNDGSGCVTCVDEAFRRAGFDSHISDNAPASDGDDSVG
jgi:hypothetical protein